MTATAQRTCREEGCPVGPSKDGYCFAHHPQAVLDKIEADLDTIKEHLTRLVCARRIAKKKLHDLISEESAVRNAVFEKLAAGKPVPANDPISGFLRRVELQPTEAYFLQHCEDPGCDLGRFRYTCPVCHRESDDYEIWCFQNDILLNGLQHDFECEDCRVPLRVYWDETRSGTLVTTRP